MYNKLMDYFCDELEELDRKVEKVGKLTMAETEYAGELLDAKKDMLETDEMEGGSSYASRSNRGGSYENRSYGSYMGGSYADGRGRGAQANRDRMGQYSSERGYSQDGDLIEEIEMLPEHKKNEIRRMIKQM